MRSKPVVLVMGVFHFRYVDDILEPYRQKEIQELSQRIAEFRPTKVCVEEVLERNDELNKEYQKFLSGDSELLADEIQQLGYRIARDLGHEQIKTYWNVALKKQKKNTLSYTTNQTSGWNDYIRCSNPEQC